jgi:ABC-type Fe3+ transport system substrate-binding protein
MKAFVGKLSPNLGGLVRGGETLRVAIGEFAILAMDGGSYQARTEQLKGAPVKHAILEDGATAVFHYLGVPRTASHPNLAKLFIHLVLSQDGQKLLFDIASYDHHALSGSRSAAELSDLTAKAVKPLLIDPQFVIDHPEDLQLRDDLTKILRQRG